MKPLPAYMTPARIAAKNLSASGYGLTEDEPYAIFARLSDAEIKRFVYTCFRTAEKLGAGQFSSTEVVSP